MDRILKSWFLTTIALALIPKFTLASPLFDGFGHCVGFPLVRCLAGDRKLSTVIERHRRGVTGIVAAIAIFSAVSLFLYQQIWQDGHRAEPQWLLTAVRSVSERPLLEWLRGHATPNTLVLSPLHRDGTTSPAIAAADGGVPGQRRNVANLRISTSSNETLSWPRIA